MLNNKFKILALILVALTVAFATSCVDDLNTSPIDDDVVTSTNVYDTPDDFRQVLAKLYAGFAATGQQGPAGNADIQGIDEGFSSYIRQLWVHQVISTDEAVVGWNDEGLPEFNFHDWGPSNDFVMAMYSRIFYEVALTNEFIRETQKRDESIIKEMEAEARFLRALSYWHALDLFGGNVPFTTEEDPIGAYMPEQTNAQDLFAYIESELLDIQDDLQAPGQNEYGRADQGAAWTLLSKLYLNAEVYIGEDRYDDALTYAERVINEGGYDLAENYENLFFADNDSNEGASEIIFPIRFDGENLQTFGGTNFIIHAAIGGSMSASSFGMDGGWAGHRVTPQFVDFFDDSDTFSGVQTENTGGFPEIYVPGGYQSSSGYGGDWSPAEAPALISENSDDVYSGQVYFAAAGSEFKFTPTPTWDDGDYGGSNGTLTNGGDNITVDQAGVYNITVDLNAMTYDLELATSEGRAMFYTDGQSLEIEELAEFTNGYAVTKWKNITSTGQPGKRTEFADTDFPMFRLADVYLMYAEATVRGASGGSASTAADYINELRERAYGNDSGNISAGDLNLDLILQERTRELYWEGHRRTDLRRFGLFTGDDYIWSWKGDVQEGAGTSSHFEIYPIPSSDINSNLNLTQNPGY
ncbi:RagB/SusD family nutrient uptake outer membrane protein [Rhodohalobacter barkolensis]|uniref:RagB/SusD family nutrient uptake outer membrane protein n=1 Tax=Rhodohalobacter barkolensis TaxID=2053187 RepID=A0A2N0VJI3_9BACT|nr:RagB/SusD family nutrient uptake outer membrane protein [Rhodohalobacter barkolensis]PKD44355.1 RagB/SusD family nutrient uptake outer membrane protein [Rhodohalobacter barkolensis]